MKKRSLLILITVLTGLLLAGIVSAASLEEIIITPEHQADFAQATVATTYAHAMTISGNDLLNVIDYDSDIAVTVTDDGINFTSTVSGDVKGDKNRYVRIAYKDGAGLLDLTALNTISGKIGADIHGDLDLSKTTNGFYVRMKSSNREVGQFIRHSSGIRLKDTILPTYANNPSDQVYLEITIPWQGSITVKNVYIYMETIVTGFADMAERITGGQAALAGNIYTVNTASQLFYTLNTIKSNKSPAIIYVDGTITYDDWSAASGSSQREISLTLDNLSIIGVETAGIFDGVGFKVAGTNIILQNLTVRYVLGRDGIQINGGKYVLIDHCTLHNEPVKINTDKDKYDELISIKNDAEYVILSWNHFYDSHKSILVGSNDGVEALPDRKLIMHHNYIENCNSRLPLYRGGHAHIYNNYFKNIDTGINCRTGSKILIEHNYFENGRLPIGYWFDDVNPSGKWDVKNNIFTNASGNTPTTSTTIVDFGPDYVYQLDPVEAVPNIVTAGAGVGKN